MKNIIFVSLLFISHFSFANVSLEGSQFVLFTSPRCSACNKLEKLMKQTDQYDIVRIKLNGKTISMKVTRYNPWLETADNDLLTKLGYEQIGIPQFAILQDEKVLGKGYPTEAFDLTISSADKPSLLPKAHESIKAYSDRLDNYFENLIDLGGLDLTKVVLKSLNLFKKEVSVPVASAFSPKLGENNILIAGTATTPFDNPLFTPTVIKKISLGMGLYLNIDPVILHGSGQSPLGDTCQIKESERGKQKDYNNIESPEQELEKREIIKVPGVRADESFTLENLAAFFEGTAKAKAKNNLLVFVGHGGREGAPAWFDVDGLTPETLKILTNKSEAQNILISGNCFGGIMAQSVTCGFMGAPPQKPASGCWEDADSGKFIKDYVSMYFLGLSRKQSDYNMDGKVSFSEAHAFATMTSEDTDEPYSSMDDLAVRYFAQNQSVVPEIISQKYFINELLANYASAEEKIVAMSIINKLPANTPIQIGVLSEDELLQLSRNQSLIRTLAKRLLFIKQSNKGAEFEARYNEIKRCENQSLEIFK